MKSIGRLPVKKIFNLSDTELEIMEFIWKAEKKLTFKEIMEYVNESMSKNWKKQTVSTYLTHLQESGLLEVDKTMPRTYLYSAACSKEEYEHLCVKHLVQKSFNGSISKFVAAFTGGKKLTKEEADELRKLI